MSFFTRLMECKPDDIKDAEYARQLGIGKDLLHSWKLIHEAGRSDFLPKRYLLERVAKALNKSQAWLLDLDSGNNGEK